MIVADSAAVVLTVQSTSRHADAEDWLEVIRLQANLCNTTRGRATEMAPARALL